MTTFLGLVLSLSLLSTPSVQTALKNQSSLGQIERIATDESTFTVQNLTSVAVGVVTIHEADQNTVKIVVTGPGGYNTSLTASAVACEINGQALSQGVPVKIVIDDHTSVRATWTSDIIVIDQQATN